MFSTTCHWKRGIKLKNYLGISLASKLILTYISKKVIWQMFFAHESTSTSASWWSFPQLLQYCGDLKWSNLNVWRSEYIAIWMVVEFASKITYSEQSREGALAAWIWRNLQFCNFAMMMKMTIQGKRICNVFAYSHTNSIKTNFLFKNFKLKKQED